MQKRNSFSLVKIILVIIVLYNAYLVLNYYKEGIKSKEIVKNLKEDVEKNVYSEDDISSEWERLKEINNDYIGWIEIPNTNINYPVVQTNDNSSYLNKDFLNRKNRFGTIFLDYNNNLEICDKNTILYGHNMKDGSMFNQLQKFKDEKFFNENKVIKLKLKDKILEFTVFSAYVESANVNYNKICFRSNKEYKEFLNTTINKSIYDSKLNLELNENSNILTLSTCDYDFKDARLVIHAIHKKI